MTSDDGNDCLSSTRGCLLNRALSLEWLTPTTEPEARSCSLWFLSSNRSTSLSLFSLSLELTSCFFFLTSLWSSFLCSKACLTSLFFLAKEGVLEVVLEVVESRSSSTFSAASFSDSETSSSTSTSFFKSCCLFSSYFSSSAPFSSSSSTANRLSCWNNWTNWSRVRFLCKAL